MATQQPTATSLALQTRALVEQLDRNLRNYIPSEAHDEAGAKANATLGDQQHAASELENALLKLESFGSNAWFRIAMEFVADEFGPGHGRGAFIKFSPSNGADPTMVRTIVKTDWAIDLLKELNLQTDETSWIFVPWFLGAAVQADKDLREACVGLGFMSVRGGCAGPASLSDVVVSSPAASIPPRRLTASLTRHKQGPHSPPVPPPPLPF